MVVVFIPMVLMPKIKLSGKADKDMIVKVSQTQMYTVWVDFQSGATHIYDIECLTFDKQQAEQYMSDHIKHFPERKYEMRVFDVGGIEDASTSALQEEINAREKEEQEEKRRMREMERWIRSHPGVSFGGWGQVYYTRNWEDME